MNTLPNLGSAHIRRHFDEELRDLGLKIQAMGAAAQNLVQLALDGVVENKTESFDKVIVGDDEVDAYYLEIEHRILAVFALQTPVASDLRFLTALLHISLHLERVADMAVNIAKIGRLSVRLPRSEGVVRTLAEEGAIALRMISAAMDALRRKDLALSMQLPTMDDPVDRMNRGILKEILPICSDERMLEWGMQMHVVSRQIERIADHAVDIAEQTAFLITGEFREFTDASHPEVTVTQPSNESR
jgi:phosphate transport system protein